MPPAATLPSAADAATALNSFQRPDSATLLSSAEQKYGVGDLRSRVDALKTLTGNLTSSISAVDPSVTGRTAGTLTTEGQRSALVNRERQPLISDLNTNNQNLSSTTGDLNVAQGNAKDMATAQGKDAEDKYNQLLQTYNISNAREEAQRAAQQAEADRQEKIRQFNVSETNQNNRASAALAAKGDTVDPAKEFSDYIAAQFKSAGGAGNKNISRQQQDAWANAFFQKNGVSQANRQGYWDLFNKTYNRSSDPTKDARYRK